MEFCFYDTESVIEVHQLPLAVEMQFDVIGKLHFVATMLLVYLHNLSASEVCLHILCNGNRNEV